MQAFMSLHNSDSDENKEGTKLMVQSKNTVLVGPKSKNQEERVRDEQEQEEAALQSTQEAPSLSAPRTKGLPPTLGSQMEVAPSPSRMRQGTQFGGDKATSLAGRLPLYH